MTCERTALVRDGGFSTRAEDGNLYIEGYFAVFGSEYKMWENAIETIDEDAFDDALNGDIRALVNHDTTLVLGRTTAGTLSLRADKTGLWGSVTINQADQDAMNLYERVKRGDVSQCSFGFDIIDQSTEVMENGTTVWKLNKVKLYEVSVVTFPAYEDTSVQARKRDYEEIQKRKKEQWREEMLLRLKGEKMALRILMLKRSIDKKKEELELLRSKDSEFETREAELEAAINEAETPEQEQAVSEEVEKFDADKSAHEEAKSALSREIEGLEADLSALEEDAPKLDEIKPNQKERTVNHMTEINIRSLPMNQRAFDALSMEQRKTIVERDDTKDF